MEKLENLEDVCDNVEMNELHHAVIENRLEAVKHLLKRGAVITNTINGGQTALHIATALGYHPIMQALIAGKPGDIMRKLINTRAFNTGSAALHMAAKNNSMKSVRFLLSHGANFEIKDTENRRPIDLTTDDEIKQLLTCIQEIFELARTTGGEVLDSKLTSCPSESLQAITYARNDQNYTSLQVAIDNGNVDAVTQIIPQRINNFKRYWQNDEKKLDKLMKLSKDARSCLSKLEAYSHEIDGLPARENWNTSIKILDYKQYLQRLLNYASDMVKFCKEQVDVNLTNLQHLIVIDESLELFGSTIERLHRQLTKDDDLKFGVKLLKLCVIAPMLLFMRSVCSLALVEAAKNNNLDVVEKCLTGKPDLNIADFQGTTSLLHAIRNVNGPMVRLLLDFGADPTWPNKYNATTRLHVLMSPRYITAQIPNWDGTRVINDLLDRIKNKDRLADYIDTKNSRGDTALHEVAELQYTEKSFLSFKYDELIKLFLSKGATYCLKNNDGSTPRDVLGYFASLDKLFAHALKGQTKPLIEAMEQITPKDKLLAFGGTRNEEGYTLVQILDRDGHTDAADKIRMLLANLHVKS